MSDPGVSERAPILTPEQQKIRDLFYQSYLYAQGDGTIQAKIFQWYRLKGYLTDEEVNTTSTGFLFGIRPPKIHAKINTSGDFPTDDIEQPVNTESYVSEKDRVEDLKSTLAEFVRVFNSPKETDENDIVDKIGQGIINRDLHYQIFGRPFRPLKEEGFTTDTNFDPHKSFIRKNVLVQTQNQPKAFEELFEAIRNRIDGYRKFQNNSDFEPIDIEEIGGSVVLRNIINKLSFDEAMKNLIVLWERNHPGEKFFSAS